MRNVFILLALLLTYATASAQTERRIYTSSELNSMQTRSEKNELTKEQKNRLRRYRILFIMHKPYSLWKR